MQQKEIFQKPQICILISLVVMLLILYFCFGFHNSTYFIDKKAAYLFINDSSNTITNDVFSLYGNKGYFLHNGLLHVLTFGTVLLLFSVLFNVKSYKNFVNINILSNKIFLYVYLNIIYPLWMYYTQKVIEAEIEKYVYPVHADSLGIAYLGIYVLLFFIGILYYPIVNIFNFIVYNTKYVSKFLILVYKVLFVAFMLYIILNMTCQYVFDYFFIYIIEIIYLLIILNAIHHLTLKIQRKNAELCYNDTNKSKT